MKRYAFLFLIVLLSVSFTHSIEAQKKGDLKVVVSNLSNETGQVKIGLYNSEDTYMGKSYMHVAQTVDSAEVVFYFKELPFGDYTFSLYHDANTNDQLDKNVLGIPQEDYAFSNNANGRFGPPAYAECVFTINESITTQSIKLN